MDDIQKKAAKALVDGPIKQSVNAVWDSLNRNVEALDIFSKYERAHKKQIRTQLENIKLLGMNSPIPLAKIYYPTHISTTIRRRLFEQEWMSDSETATKRVEKPNKKEKNQSGVDYVNENSKVVVLGGPGAGKTTFLRFLALLHADVIPGDRTKHDAVPFFIHLPNLAKTGKSIFDFASELLVKATDQYALDYSKRLFESSKCIVLLDSLDEVPVNQRPDLIAKIKDFEALYPEMKIVISCRAADYEEVLPNFCEVEIARLSLDAITKIIRAWFEGDSTKATRLISLIKNDDGVAALTETPLLLSLLCIQYRHDLQLPKRKTELYRRCLDTLLRDWDAERGFRRDTAYQGMSDDRKERLFEHVAGNFFVEQEVYEFKRTQLLSVVATFLNNLDLPEVDPSDLMDEIERHHGIIEQLSQDYFCFSHTSMQDYFVARHLLSRRIELDVIAKNIENETWFPVIEFVIALAEDPAPILNLLIKKSSMEGLSNFPPMARRTKTLMLLYRGMASSPFISKDMAEKCFKHLVKSQILMAKIFQTGMVIPIAEFGGFGVRHLLFHMQRPRPTLGDALQPFRKFSNQIASTPLKGYADACFKAVNEIQISDKQKFLNDILIINLVTPLGMNWPKEVSERLKSINESTSLSFLKTLLAQSLTYIDTVQKKNFPTVQR